MVENIGAPSPVVQIEFYHLKTSGLEGVVLINSASLKPFGKPVHSLFGGSMGK